MTIATGTSNKPPKIRRLAVPKNVVQIIARNIEIGKQSAIEVFDSLLKLNDINKM